MMEYGVNIRVFGAVGDGQIDCTKAFQEAIECVSQGGGGRIVVPAGKYLTGAIVLKSYIELHLEIGAEILFIKDKIGYPAITSSWEGIHKEVHTSCIYGKNLQDIAITGYGTINGQGEYWWAATKAGKVEVGRPKLISLEACENVKVEGVKLINSPSWTLHPLYCKNVNIDKVTISNPADSPNTDGIDPESCRNVHISNCHIDVGDDCIAIKAGADPAVEVACENITIMNCTMVHGHGGVVIGSEMSGSVRNVAISNCVFEGTDRGIRFKSRRGRGGCIEDIRVNQIMMKDVICSVVMNLFYFCGAEGKKQYIWDKKKYPITNETPTFRRIHFSNITATEVRACAGYLYGLPERPIEDITFNNMTIIMADDAEPVTPAMMSGCEPVTAKGFYIRNTKNVEFNHTTIKNHIGKGFNIALSEEIKLIGCREEEKRIGNWSIQMAESVLARPLCNANRWGYENGVVMKGMESVWRKTGDTRYLQVILQWADEAVDEEGNIINYHVEDFNIDHVNNGKILLIAYKETQKEKYKKALNTLREQLEHHPRTQKHVFWHKKIYEHQIWLDGLYMGAPFYAEYISLFEEESVLQDVINQFVVSYECLRDDDTGLLYHAWDETRQQFWCNPQTGLSKNFWGRAMGWYAMALVDVLDYIPEGFEGRAKLIKMLQEIMNALVKVKDTATEVWYQVLDKGENIGNYLEASASSMIVYAMAKGTRKGYLDDSWKVQVKRSYNGLVKQFITITDTGFVNLNKNCAVAGLGGIGKRDGSYAYYISEPIVVNDGKGVGAFLQASVEVEQL